MRLRPPKWELPRDELEAAITPRTKAIVINTPMNPIGKTFGDDDLRFVADLMLKHDLVAIADEVYEHLVFDGRRHKTLFALPEVRDRVVRIGSAGKTFSVTGWKVGYVTADAKLIAPIVRAHQFVTFTTPPALQSAVAFGLEPARFVFPRASVRVAGAAGLSCRRDCGGSASTSAKSARPISRWRGLRVSTGRATTRNSAAFSRSRPA